MDYPSYSILRPAPKLSDHLHRVGHWGSASSCASWRFYLSALWEEMVRAGSFTIGLRQQTWFYRTLRRGKHRLLLWPDQEADGSTESVTPSKSGAQDEMGRLEKVLASCCSLTERN